jgi:hypothetical protein
LGRRKGKEVTTDQTTEIRWQRSEAKRQRSAAYGGLDLRRAREGGSVFWLEQGAAATCCSTETSRFFFYLVGDGLVHLQGIVVKKFFARPQVA